MEQPVWEKNRKFELEPIMILDCSSCWNHTYAWIWNGLVCLLKRIFSRVSIGYRLIYKKKGTEINLCLKGTSGYGLEPTLPSIFPKFQDPG